MRNFFRCCWSIGLPSNTTNMIRDDHWILLVDLGNCVHPTTSSPKHPNILNTLSRSILHISILHHTRSVQQHWESQFEIHFDRFLHLNRSDLFPTYSSVPILRSDPQIQSSDLQMAFRIANLSFCLLKLRIPSQIRFENMEKRFPKCNISTTCLDSSFVFLFLSISMQGNRLREPVNSCDEIDPAVRLLCELLDSERSRTDSHWEFLS